ncbi:hypothetical protein EYC80_008223 [Monilinia laxa]|uniref:Uncharacterized protein n=1 Tax=Monilinia laxa TaxID=61186 RepID=A0A5N6JTW3_MONLA|nr:hypothetical protein EYC80_008223 [Monilinia laxa]
MSYTEQDELSSGIFRNLASVVSVVSAWSDYFLALSYPHHSALVIRTYYKELMIFFASIPLIWHDLVSKTTGASQVANDCKGTALFT